MVKQHMSKIPKRRIDSHKGDYGHVFVIAGSQGLTGAAYLACQAAMISGSGLVTLAIPKSLNPIMEVKLTEVMTFALPETKDLTLSLGAEKNILDFVEGVNVVAMGPGLSRNEETRELILKLIEKISKPLVLDADALNALSENPGLLKKRKNVAVLTPHPGEMARLIGKDISYVQKNREKVAKEIALEYNCVAILKGYKTIIANPSGETYVNDTGNSGMSTGGVGDVLTGMVASFMGQGIDAYSASVLSVYFHGKAGDVAAKDKGQLSMIATDILDKLPHVLKEYV